MGLAGASIEWYDFLLYGTAAALVFPTVFFPASMPPFVAQLASFSTFAVGFIARPFGGILFGHLGDRVGRKAAFVMALLLMGMGTVLIGLLPSYASAGAWAPVSLVALRFAQGLAVGGQWGGATLVATESAPPGRRGFFGSFAQAGVFVGVLLANIAVLTASNLTTPAGFMSYGWRVPFLLSALLIGLAWYVHRRVEETAAFRELPAQSVEVAGAAGAPHRSPVLAALRTHPARILLGAGTLLPLQANFYVVVTYSIAYGTSPSGLALPRNAMLGCLLLAMAIATPVCLLAGAWSDRVGRARVMLTGVALMGVSGLLFFGLLETRSLPLIALAMTFSIVANAIAYGPLGTLFAELFATHMRYSGMSLAYQLGAIVGGSFVPMIATALYARFHTNQWMGYYIALCAVIALVCVGQLRKMAAADER
jgi:MFS family permease